MTSSIQDIKSDLELAIEHLRLASLTLNEVATEAWEKNKNPAAAGEYAAIMDGVNDLRAAIVKLNGGLK